MDDKERERIQKQIDEHRDKASSYPGAGRANRIVGIAAAFGTMVLSALTAEFYNNGAPTSVLAAGIGATLTAAAIAAETLHSSDRAPVISTDHGEIADGLAIDLERRLKEDEQ